MERDASMTEDYYCYSSSTLLRYTEDCSTVVGTAATRDVHNETNTNSQTSRAHDRLGETKAVGKKQRGVWLTSQGFY